jgi:uncharacterized protein YecE (DUF72 family)
MTHVYRLKEPKKGGTGLFFSLLEPLKEAGKLGPVLWQLPENFKRDDGRLAGVLGRAPKGIRHAFEFRHESWFTKDVYEILRFHNAALVVSDHPKWPFQTREITADWTYVRLHYGRGRDGNYTKAQLDTWKRRIAAWRSRADVYVYVNNDWQGFAVRNAAYLRGEKL